MIVLRFDLKKEPEILSRILRSHQQLLGSLLAEHDWGDQGHKEKLPNCWICQLIDEAEICSGYYLESPEAKGDGTKTKNNLKGGDATP